MTTEIDLSGEIERVVSRRWSDSGSPILLSQVGEKLSPGAQAELRVYNGGLKRYIETHLSDRLRFVRMEAHGGGVVPRQQTEALSDEELEALYVERRAAVTHARRPSYFPPLWWAFKNPISEGQRRFVSIGGPGEIELHHLEPGQEPNASWLEIKTDEIVEPDTPGAALSFDKVSAAIQSWAEGKIESSRLVIPSATRTAHTKPRVGLDTPSRHTLGSLGGLIAGLRGFTKEELSRIHIPADVMLSFLERSSRGR